MVTMKMRKRHRESRRRAITGKMSQAGGKGSKFSPLSPYIFYMQWLTCLIDKLSVSATDNGKCIMEICKRRSVCSIQISAQLGNWLSKEFALSHQNKNAPIKALNILIKKNGLFKELYCEIQTKSKLKVQHSRNFHTEIIFLENAFKLID